MAFDFNLPAGQPYIGTPYGVPISRCTPMTKPPQVVPIEIDWALYGASSIKPVAINLNLLQFGTSGNPLDAIRSVYIDNSFSFVDIYVYFPDTQFMVICPANSICMSPVFTSGFKAVIYAQDFMDNNLPTTTIHFTNVPEHGYVISTGEFTPPPIDIPATVSYTAFSTFGGFFTSHDFGSLPIGTADPTRCIYAVLHWNRSPVAGSIDQNGMSIAGNAMTLLVTEFVADQGVAIFALPFATGTTADFFAQWTDNVESVQCDIFAGYNLLNPLAATVGSVNGPNMESITVTSLNEGIAIAGQTPIFGVTPVSITGLNNVHTSAVGSVAWEQTAGQNITAAYNQPGNEGCMVLVTVR